MKAIDGGEINYNFKTFVFHDIVIIFTGFASDDDANNY